MGGFTLSLSDCDTFLIGLFLVYCPRFLILQLLKSSWRIPKLSVPPASRRRWGGFERQEEGNRDVPCHATPRRRNMSRQVWRTPSPHFRLMQHLMNDNERRTNVSNLQPRNRNTDANQWKDIPCLGHSLYCDNKRLLQKVHSPKFLRQLCEVVSN